MYTFKLLEYLFLSKMTKEINGRLYIDEEMWKVINECTVDLIVETERERERWADGAPITNIGRESSW